MKLGSEVQFQEHPGKFVNLAEARFSGSRVLFTNPVNPVLFFSWTKVAVARESSLAKFMAQM